MTPAMIRRLWKRWEAREKREQKLADARIAPLTLRVFNYLRESGSRAIQVGDLFPSLGEPYHFPTIEELAAGRKWAEERLARIEAGLPVEPILAHPQTEQMMHTVREFTDNYRVGQVIHTKEPITRPH